MASSVLKRTAFAFPVFKMDKFAKVISTFSDKIFKGAMDIAQQNESKIFNSFFNREKMNRFAQNSNENVRYAKTILFYSLKIK